MDVFTKGALTVYASADQTREEGKTKTAEHLGSN